MSIESGAVTLRRLYIRGRVKASSDPIWMENLKLHAFTEHKLGPEEENKGWAVSGNELHTDFNLTNTVFGKFIVLSLRKDTKRIQRTMLNLKLKERIRLRMIEMETDKLPAKQKSELKTEVIDELNKSTPANIQIVQVIVDPSRKEVYVSSTNEKLVSEFSVLFEKSFEVRLEQAHPKACAHKLLDKETFEKVEDRPGIEIVENLELHPDFENSQEEKLGAAFLTWLFYYLRSGDGRWKGANVGEFGIHINDYLLFEGEALGTKQTLLKQGPVASSAELATVLRIGKQISKASLHFAREDGTQENENWIFYINKANFDLSSLKVPKYNEGNQATRTLGRFNYLVESFQIIDDLFLSFLELRYSNKWSSAVKEIRSWVKLLQQGT
jgi:hypothetical protein